ncbi:24220_t:CDS:2, partial [Cetraspora pellucida]
MTKSELKFALENRIVDKFVKLIKEFIKDYTDKTRQIDETDTEDKSSKENLRKQINETN